MATRMGFFSVMGPSMTLGDVHATVVNPLEEITQQALKASEYHDINRVAYESLVACFKKVTSALNGPVVNEAPKNEEVNEPEAPDSGTKYHF